MEKTRTISVRMPTDIYNHIRRTARRERRSFGKQIVLYVEQQIRADEQRTEHFPTLTHSEAEEVYSGVKAGWPTEDGDKPVAEERLPEIEDFPDQEKGEE